MDIFKEATRQKVRFNTSKGNLTTEQLWDLPLTELDELAVSLEQEHKDSGKKSFLNGTAPKDKVAKLKFNVVLDVLNTKVEEEEAARQKKEDKEHNEKIMKLIQEKRDKNLGDKSLKELEAMLR